MKDDKREITVVPYDASWPEQFQREADSIRDSLGESLVAVHHVGSTSVPGLASKPRIDIIAVVQDRPGSIEPLSIAGFEYRGEYNIPFHHGFRKRSPIYVNLHVYDEGNPEIELNLMFRDFLRAHPEICREYEKLKFELLSRPSSFKKINSMLTGYNRGKNDFIHDVLRQAGFDRLRMMKCVHELEWAAAKSMRQRMFFDRVPISDPYQWTFNHPEHIHLVLYRGVDVIGVSHLQFWKDNRVAMRIIAIDESERKKGFGTQFIQWIELWLIEQKVKSLHIEASPESVSFYRQLGYVDMPFDDPDGYEGDGQDVSLGKRLVVQ